MTRALPLFFLLACVPMACQRGGGGAPPAIPLVVAAGPSALDPEPEDRLSSRLHLRRLELPRPDRVYRLTTPADTPFSFDVLTRSEGNAGWASVSLAHAADGVGAPAGGIETLAAAGCVVSGTGLSARPLWIDAHGDGFARLSVRGAIGRSQVLAFATHSGQGRSVALVELAIGPRSAINQEALNASTYPGILERTTLYSSDSWVFGLPAAAVSGDRTSIVAYEGDRADWGASRRYQLRLQHDRATSAVTGGGSLETSLDSGHWRDHELAALFNVLALAHGGSGGVTVKLSFDRGASFAQTETFAGASWSTRLVQVAMAADYTLAVLYWESRGAFHSGSELILVEGRPDAFDLGGSPTHYAFDPPRVLRGAAGDVTPILMEAEYSSGGDLVVGYAFTSIRGGPDRTWISTTEFRCATRIYDQEWRDELLEQDVLVGRDPNVALLGSGPGLRIFCAYEARDGVRLRTSDNAGLTFSAPIVIGLPGAHTPQVFARQQGGATAVDVIYLADAGDGTELHLCRWPDFGNGSRENHRLTQAVRTLSAGGGGHPWWGPIGYGFRITQVAWLGYDAVQDGDDLVVVYDEETFDAAFLLGGAPWSGGLGGMAGPTTTGGFRPATPPPLAPGMTQPVPAVDPTHRHQLKLLRLE
jgi:hypothetical protein